MYSQADNYLNVVATNACWVLFEKAVPAGKLKREFISFATHDRRPLKLTTPHGFSASPFEIPRAIFDDCLANKFIEQDGPEDADGRILFRLTQTGRTRADLARAVNTMAVAPYRDFD
jgi:hypothetical protein